MPNILGINLSYLDSLEAQEKIINFLNSNVQHYIVTPNPEIILKSQEDEEFFYILNKANLSLADGFGLKIAGFILNRKIKRVTGSDMTLSLLNEAAKSKRKVLILNWQDGLSKASDINSALLKEFPNLSFLVLDVPRLLKLNPEDSNKIINFAPTLLFCTFGFPWQEKLIYHNLKSWPSVRAAIGVGGSFDFITGKIHRAPKLLRNLGLEWLWRLGQQPKRYRRIFRAIFIFLIKVFRAKFINRFRYRPNVACLLYKNTSSGKKILIVKREDDFDHWQLPQGGTDGQKPAMAGRRELEEEVGVKNIVDKALFKNIYSYKYADRIAPKKYQPTSAYEVKKYKFDYKGQKQSLYVAEFLGQDQEIKINFWDHADWRWVSPEALVKSLHPVRQDSASLFLKKFLSLKI